MHGPSRVFRLWMDVAEDVRLELLEAEPLVQPDRVWPVVAGVELDATGTLLGGKPQALPYQRLADALPAGRRVHYHVLDEPEGGARRQQDHQRQRADDGT